jgi:hypothetical protein
VQVILEEVEVMELHQLLKEEETPLLMEHLLLINPKHLDT